MASTQTSPSMVLGELLREAQEPFILEAYLSERGYVSRNSKSEPSNKLLKSVFKKLLVISKRLRIKNCDDKEAVIVPEMTRNSKQEMEARRLSQSEKHQPSISLHDREDSKSCNLRKDEAHTDRKLQRSVTELHKSTTHPLNDKDIAKNQEKKNRSVARIFKVTEDSLLSASMWELLVSSDKFQVGELVNGSKPKRALQQNKQLLFDCVREIIARKEARFLGPEEIGNLISLKIKEWGKLSGNGTQTQLLNLDYQESIQEWNDCKAQKKELAITIGDDIMEELRKELVMDMAAHLSI